MLTRHVSISFIVTDDFWLGFHPLAFGILYPPQRFWIVYLTYHHAGLWPWAKLVSMLHFSDGSAGVTSESTLVVERSLIRNLIAVSIMSRFAKSMQDFIWHFVRCLIAIVDSVPFQIFIWCPLMEIDCSINWFSQELIGSLGVNQYCTAFSVIVQIIHLAMQFLWLG